jgi:hypothetical protein
MATHIEIDPHQDRPTKHNSANRRLDSRKRRLHHPLLAELLLDQSSAILTQPFALTGGQLLQG